MRRAPTIPPAQVARLAAHLRQMLDCAGLVLSAPAAGQSVQVKVDGQFVGTLDTDPDGDYIVTIAIAADELEEARR